MFTLSNIPCWYKLVSMLLSSYQAYRGFMLQWILGIKEIDTKGRKVVLLCLADAFTYFVCAFSGYISLFVLYSLMNQEADSARGHVDHALLIFLLLYGVLGITGKLPDLLQSFKFPKTD
jgi:hypothetical protein